VKSDTSEKGLESLIVAAMTGQPSSAAPSPGKNIGLIRVRYGGTGWILGQAQDYDREFCVDLPQLRSFLNSTQPQVAEALGLDHDSPARRKFLARLQGEISKRGVIDVLRHGVKDGPHHIDLFFGTPSTGNEKAQGLYEANRFSVTRQLRYSRDETQRALDLGLFINGLPIATFELKNSLTKQTVEDAVEQYKRDRDPRERLFEFGRCVVHFALDDHEVRFCTHLKGKGSWFLPFNLGWDDGAGNPPNPHGIKTD
jgi:type I restriction enzyme R subunit